MEKYRNTCARGKLEAELLVVVENIQPNECTFTSPSCDGNVLEDDHIGLALSGCGGDEVKGSIWGQEV